eukprot:TRINITY_DN11180_c0_g1_i1.p1 TRINITY_DN11180_c0_g1~~TRINITY_DN11180_c0_g1_i1.p1  ORF type:complete len:991 (+),score=312.51 TRINITY_DN11180_c0_g1_i1:199-3171(+)
MAEEFQRAVFIDASPESTLEQRQEAFIFIQHFEAGDGWLSCSQLLESCEELHPVLAFASLKIVESTVSKRYCTLGPSHRASLKQLVMRLCHLDQPLPTFLRNKIAQLFALLFRNDYPHQWDSCCHQLLALLDSPHAWVVDMYLRILRAINDEIADRELHRTQQEEDANTQLKDELRDRDVTKLMQGCYRVVHERSDDGELASMALSVVSQYINWIDIGLVVNPDTVQLLRACMQRPTIMAQQACECVTAVMLKGMSPDDKIAVIQQLDLWNDIQALAYQLVQHADNSVSAEDRDNTILTAVGRCIDAMAFVVLQDTLKNVSEEASAELLAAQLEIVSTVLPEVLVLLGHPDDDVSETQLPSVQAYLALVKGGGQVLDEQHQGWLQQLLSTTVVKLKYEADDEPNDGSEEDAVFQEFRKELKVVLGNLCFWNLETVLDLLGEHITGTFAQWKDMSWNEVELCLFLLYSLTEHVVQITRGQSSDEPGSLLARFQSLVQGVLEHNVVDYPHPAVVVQVFEVLGRNPKHIAQDHCVVAMLTAFLGPAGVLSADDAIRSRCCYLMSTIMKDKHVKPLLAQYIDRIVELLTPVLDLQRLLNAALLPEDQLFLFEGISWALVQDTVPNDVKQARLSQFVDPLLQLYQSDLACMQQGQLQADDELRIADRLCHVMGCVMRLSKGFTSKTLRTSGCQPIFVSSLELFLAALALPMQRSKLHSSVRMYLHRMIVALGDDVLDCIPAAITGLLTNHTADDLQEFIPLINHLIAKFKGKVQPFLDQVFLPLVEAIFAFLNQLESVASDQHAFAELSALRHGYFTFLHTVVNNGCCAVLTSPRSIAQLDAILTTLINAATGVDDVRLQKQCFSTLNALTAAWSRGEVELPDYEQLLATSVVPGCFAVPLASRFDLQDAQASMCLGEICSLLLVVTRQMNGPLLGSLQQEQLPALGFTAEEATHVVQALHQLNQADARSVPRNALVKKLKPVFLAAQERLHRDR